MHIKQAIDFKAGLDALRSTRGFHETEAELVKQIRFD